MNIAEQIRAFEEKRAALVAANEAIIAKAADEGSTLDAEQEEEFDNNQADIEAVDKHLKRLKAMEETAKSKAVPAAGGNAEEAAVSRSGGRSEEHTSELQSLMRISYAVFCLKKNNTTHEDLTTDLDQ